MSRNPFWFGLGHYRVVALWTYECTFVTREGAIVSPAIRVNALNGERR